jgi:hypothetical protein
MSFSIRLTEEERTMAETYAKLHGVSLAEAFKKALFDRIEDEYDLRVVEEYEKEKLEGTLETRPIEKLWKDLNL